MSDHEPPDSTNPSEIEALLARLKDNQLGAEDRRLIDRLLRLLLTLIRVVRAEEHFYLTAQAPALWSRCGQTHGCCSNFQHLK